MGFSNAPQEPFKNHDHDLVEGFTMFYTYLEPYMGGCWIWTGVGIRRGVQKSLSDTCTQLTSWWSDGWTTIGLTSEKTLRDRCKRLIGHHESLMPWWCPSKISWEPFFFFAMGKSRMFETPTGHSFQRWVPWWYPSHATIISMDWFEGKPTGNHRCAQIFPWNKRFSGRFSLKAS